MSAANVLILGTYHFANPGLDYVQTQTADVLSEQKQVEIMAVLDKLTPFEPTKIAVEFPYNQDDELNQLYAAYRSDMHQLTRNEIQQLGFRLADRHQHDQIYAIDHPGNLIPFDKALAYAEKHQPTYMTKFQQTITRWEAESNQYQQSLSVRGILYRYNQPQAIAENHQLYLDFTAVDAGDTFIGAQVLAGWYARNIYIFANLQQIAQPDDRILLIYGAGHLAILQELVDSDVNLNLIDTLDYL